MNRRDAAIGGMRRSLRGGAAASRYPATTLTLTARSTAVLGSSLIYGSAFSPTLGRWVFVGDVNGGAPQAAYSDDRGVTWVAATIPAGTWNSVVWAGTQFVAVGRVGGYDTGLAVVATSSDGITWTSRTPAALSQAGNSIAWDGTTLVAVGTLTLLTLGIQTSTDGITWTNRTSALSNNDNGWICWASTLGLFVCVNNIGTADCVQTSPDGVTWTARTGIASGTFCGGLSYSPALGLVLATMGDGTTMRSTDGITWAAGAAVAGVDNWYANTWVTAKGVFVAVGVGTQNIGVSSDGITFTTQNAGVELYAVGADTSGALVLFDNGTYSTDSVPYTGALT